MSKPKGYYKKKDRQGRMVTHPVFADKHHLHHEEHAKVYSVPMRTQRIIAFDVDGTLTVGDPAGTIKLSALRDLKDKGWTVGIISNAATRQKVKDAFHDEADFFLTKPKAYSMKLIGKGFGKKVYVGNSTADQKASEKANWEYVKPEEFAEKVKA